MENIVLRPMTRDDFPSMGRWLAAPHVARWWMSPSTPEYIEENYGPAIDGHDPTDLLVVDLDGRPVGMIERYRVHDHPEWEASLRVLTEAGSPFLPADGAGIDYFIGEEELTGKGLGTRLIRQVSREAFEHYPEAAFIVAAPQQANRPSWRALERAGFTRAWEGTLESDDPGDAGPAYVYVLERPE